MKRVVAILLSSLLLFGIGTTEKNVTAVSAESNTVSENIFEIQREACQANEILYASFEWENGYVYPDDFGGTYIDYDTLYVLIKSGGDIEKYKAILSKFDNVEYEYVEYSYNELQFEAKKVVENDMKNINVVSYGVDVMKNKALIGVEYNSSERAVAICEKNDKVIIEQQSNYRSEASLVGGASISSSDGYSFTLGVSGTYNNAVAFLTCGHTVTAGSNLSVGSSTFGTVSLWQFENNGDGDYAIATAASGYTESSLVFTTSGSVRTFYGYLLNPPVGTYLYKYGKESGQAYCQVIATGVSVRTGNNNSTNSSKIINNLTRASLISGTSAEGDSGGPYRSGSDFCGIHNGSSVIDGIINVFFTPYVYPYNEGFIVSTN